MEMTEQDFTSPVVRAYFEKYAGLMQTEHAETGELIDMTRELTLHELSILETHLSMLLGIVGATVYERGAEPDFEETGFLTRRLFIANKEN